MSESQKLFFQAMAALKASYPHQYKRIGDALIQEWPDDRQLAWRFFIRVLWSL